MKGRFPDILNNPATGEAARKLYDDAQRDARPDHRREVADRQRRARACSRPTRSATTSRSTPTTTREPGATTLHTLRQQGQHRDGVPNRALADFVAPKDTGLRDHVGAFAVTAGLGAQERIARVQGRRSTTTRAILLESLADRLAEAFAERLHERVRRDLWGYAPDEHLDNEDLIAEQYAGIRPAPGYPACPDHTEKQRSGSCSTWRSRTGIQLTESMAMWPGAAVSGWYFSHPQSQYFVVGRLGRDQVEDYADAQGLVAGRGRALAGPEPRLRAGGLTAPRRLRIVLRVQGEHGRTLRAGHSRVGDPAWSASHGAVDRGGGCPARRRESTGELARRIPTGRRRTCAGPPGAPPAGQSDIRSTVPGMSTAVQTAPPRRREPLPQRTAALSPSRAADFMAVPAALPVPGHRPAPQPAQPGRRPRDPRARRAGAPLRPARRRPHPRARRRAARAGVGAPRRGGARARHADLRRRPTPRPGVLVRRRGRRWSTPGSRWRTRPGSSRPSASSTSRPTSTG